MGNIEFRWEVWLGDAEGNPVGEVQDWAHTTPLTIDLDRLQAAADRPVRYLSVRETRREA
jgi:hypothetical protein